MNQIRRILFPIVVSLFVYSCGSNSDSKNTSNTNTNEEINNTSTVAFEGEGLNSETFIQTFEINPTKEQEIKGENGTVIIFPNGCFGNIRETVKVNLIECYSIPNILFNKLTTSTFDGKLLESDGMIYLNAFSEKGDTLKIKSGKLKIQMPTIQVKEGIQIFEGIEDNDHINWKLSNEKMITKNVPVGDYTTEDEVISQNPKRKDSLSQNNVKKLVDKKIKNENLLSYVFQITKMGWINCDRYIESKNPVELIVEINPNDKAGKFYLVFGNSNSIVVGDEMANTESKLIFKNIPKNEPITIVGMYTEGDKIFFAMKDYKVTGESISFPALTLTSRDDLSSAMLEKFGKDIWSRPRPSL